MWGRDRHLREGDPSARLPGRDVVTSSGGGAPISTKTVGHFTPGPLTAEASRTGASVRAGTSCVRARDTAAGGGETAPLTQALPEKTRKTVEAQTCRVAGFGGGRVAAQRPSKRLWQEEENR